MLLQKLQVNIVSNPIKKWLCVPKKTHQHFSHLYNQKTNLSSKFWNPATPSLSSLWIPISPKSNFSLFLFLPKKNSFSSFFSLESKIHLPQFSTQTSTMLSHAFLFTPNLHHLIMLSHHLSSLSFFILPSTVSMQYLSILGSQP